MKNSRPGGWTRGRAWGCGSDSGMGPVRMAADLFAARVDLTIGATPKAVVINDLDADGRVDMVVARATGSGSLSMLLARGNSTYSRAEINNRFWRYAV